MKLVMTLLVRDEEDILREHLEYHLNAGVDLVLATDHRSSDGTMEILRSYAADGAVVVAREEGEFAQQAAWQTRMARAAATDHGADWVIASDADEFWWPRGDSLKDVLARVPRRYGVVYALMQNFVPRSEGDERFLERMIVRLAVQAPINDPATPFRPVVKVAHRGDPRAVIEKGGGHDVRGVEGEPLRSWHPLEVLHFPFRSREQSDRKYRKTWTGWERNPRADLARAQMASVQGRSGLMWDRLALDDADIERGIEGRSLVTDVRLRDAVRGLLDRATSPATSRARDGLGVDAFGSAVFSEAEVVRLQRWLDDVHRRVTHIERRP